MSRSKARYAAARSERAGARRARRRGGGGGGGRGGRGAAPTPEGRLSAQQVTQRITALLRDNPPALRLTPAGRRPHSRRHRRAERRGPDLRRQASQISPGVILRNDDYGRISRHHRGRHAGVGRVQRAESVLPRGLDVVRDRRRDSRHRQGRRSRDARRPSRFVDERDGRHRQRDRLRDHDRGRAHSASPSARSRAARFASRCGAAKKRGSSDRSRTSTNHFGIGRSSRSPTTRSSTRTGTSTTARARVRGAIDLRAAGSRRSSSRSSSSRSKSGASTARRHRRRASRAAATTARSRWPGCRASARSRIRSNTTARPGTPNLDNYERIVPDDVMKNAVMSASVVYSIANRDKMMPRFAPGEMPAVPAGRGGGAGRGNLAGAEPHMFFVPKGKALTVAAPGLVRRHRGRDRARDPAGNRRGCRRAGARQARAEAGRELRLHARAQLRGQRHVHVHADAKRGDHQSRHRHAHRAVASISDGLVRRAGRRTT